MTEHPTVVVLDARPDLGASTRNLLRAGVEAGFVVHLVARSLPADDEELVAAGVHLHASLHPTPMARHPTTWRRAVLRSPVAYRPGTEEARLQLALAMRDDVVVWRAARRRGQAGRVAGKAFGRLAGVRLRWVRRRRTATRRLARVRGRLNRPLDRATGRGWELLLGPRAWTRLSPGVWDGVLGLGPVVDRLQPDLVHVVDWRLLPVGARSVIEARDVGLGRALVWERAQPVPDHDASRGNRRRRRAQTLLEEDYRPFVDEVVTNDLESEMSCPTAVDDVLRAWTRLTTRTQRE